ncbi:hypothetical protein CH63R_04848 [Colletotrichum higginsianum IMI 349063]|uniref:Uncharacterized protein n=1 Tax=Colletotrichum higginsianum (strain IMI 349063) TaxID=759273 RepID=A0A1B7YKS4_COLHI|nr:hypothetical protein CH63R_04848 [Colletotrichum higginsianum IMI 349063]OBR12552.1 hypothetical protein CH63R_04848 [Colletotrichum higginsianum IMI 349063]
MSPFPKKTPLDLGHSDVRTQFFFKVPNGVSQFLLFLAEISLSVEEVRTPNVNTPCCIETGLNELVTAGRAYFPSIDGSTGVSLPPAGLVGWSNICGAAGQMTFEGGGPSPGKDRHVDLETVQEIIGLGCRCAAMVPDLEGPSLGNSSPEAMSMPGTHLNITQRFYTWRGNHGPKKERGQWHQRPPCYDAGRSLVGSKYNQSADGLLSVWTSGRGPESTFEEPSTKK